MARAETPQGVAGATSPDTTTGRDNHDHGNHLCPQALHAGGVVRGTAEIRAIRAMRGDSGTSDDDRCTVAAEKHLTAAEWADFTGDFFRDRDWLANFARQNVGDCIRVTGDGAQLALIVDPQGYGYARYVGIEPTD